MTVTKRIQDLLPAMIVFFLVGVFGTYATVAFVVNDPWWVDEVAELKEAKAAGVDPVADRTTPPDRG